MNQKRKIEIVLYLIILSTTIGFRYKLLLLFGFEYTDSDQAIMWNGLNNYANGNFHEPRFYGQTYNTMLEALLAVPLYKLGVPAHKSLVIITTLLTLFPFWLLSFITFKRKSTITGLIILSIPLLMPIEYHLLTSLSRGFVTGIFIASFGTISLFYINKKWAFFLLAFTSVLGYSISANAVLLSLPCLLYVFLFNIKNVSFYTFSSIGLAFGVGLHVLANSFYVIYPNYNLHRYKLDYSIDLLLEGITNLDYFLNDVSPLFWNQGFIWILVFLILGIILLWKKRIQFGLTLITIPALIIFTLGFSKIHDGSNSIFFSVSRMYLALPILIATCISFIVKLRVNNFFFVIPLIAFTYNFLNLNSVVLENTHSNRKHVVAVSTFDKILKKCEQINSVCSANDIELVVIVNHYYYDFLNYGCPVCVEGFPKTLRPSYERRTWRLLEDEKVVYRRILFIDLSKKLDQNFTYIEPVEAYKNMFILRNNALPTMELLEKMKISVRKYK
jgi:hypothetical protein